MTVLTAQMPDGRIAVAKPATVDVRVKSITFEANDINAFELRPLDGRALPPFAAGAHIDLRLPNGLVRSYSLINPQHEQHRYVIAVKKDAAGRGGSRFMHEEVRAGDVLTIGTPRNNFALAEDATHSLLIAGGIGITPLWSMVQRLEELGRSWELHYCARTRNHAAFLDRLEALGGQAASRLHLTFDQEPGGRMLDIGAVVAGAKPDAHLYCCGPAPMLSAFEKAARTRPPANVHVEYFAAPGPPAADGGFTVVLVRSGRSLPVPKGKTILSVLLGAGLDVPHSCMEGVCGTCETKVLDGIPDHRDTVMTAAEKAANKTAMICCAGCKSGTLVLDL